MNAAVSGHQRSTVTVNCRTSGMSESAHHVGNFQRGRPTWFQSAPVMARARRLRRFSLAIHVVSRVCCPIAPRRRVPHRRELLVGEVLTAAQQAPAGRPLRIGGSSASAADLGGGTAPGRREHLVRQLRHVEVVDRDPGARHAGADRGAVGSGHVDGDVCGALSPSQRGGGEPGRHVGDAAVLDLAQQRARPEGVGEAGVPPIACPARLPVSGSCSQARLAPTGPHRCPPRRLRATMRRRPRGPGRGRHASWSARTGADPGRPGRRRNPASRMRRLAATRTRMVIRAPAGGCGSCSVDDRRGQGQKPPPRTSRTCALLTGWHAGVNGSGAL